MTLKAYIYDRYSSIIACIQSVKVTGYSCVPCVRARGSGQAIPIQRNSKADTSCREIFIYARAR